MQRRTWVLAAIAAVGIIGWAAFRPERIWIDKTVHEELATVATAAAANAASTELVAGRFRDGAHPTSGSAAIYRTPDGKRVLRLTNFHTSNGPDVRVYLVAARDVMDNDTVKNSAFVDLGALKGNIGDQNYDVALDVDLEKYRSVTIWCRRFGVNFGTASLVNSDGATNEPMTIGQGAFHSVAHETNGSATVYRLADGKRVLRLTDFETSNGPDVRVYLVAAMDAKDNDTVKNTEIVDLGALKGNVGDQNYDLPASVDVDKYRSVTIWCRRFGVNFGTAPLERQAS